MFSSRGKPTAPTATAQQLYVNTTKCDTCVIEGCRKCKDIYTCQECIDTEVNGFELIGGSCGKCDSTNENMFLVEGKCQHCNLFQTGCTTCKNATACSACDTSNNFTLDANTETCVHCDSSKNMFVIEGLCETCNLDGCLTCEDLTTCIACDEENGWVLDETTCKECKSSEKKFAKDGKCETCILDGCNVCATLDICEECDSNEVDGYYKVGGECKLCNSSNGHFMVDGECQPCSQTGCSDCKNATACSICDTSSNYFLDASTETCNTCDSSKNLFFKDGKC